MTSCSLIRSGSDGFEWYAHSALQVGSGGVGRGQCVGILTLRIEQRATRIDDFKRRRSADSVAGSRRAVRLAGRRQQLISYVDRLSQRRARRSVSVPHVLADLCFQIAVGCGQLALEMSGLAHLTLRMLPEQQRKRKRKPGG